MVQPATVANADLVNAFLQAMQQMSAENRDTTLAAIAEMKKPSAEQQAKDELERERSMQLTMRRVDSAKREESRKSEAHKTCTHTMPNGKTRLRGQRFSNGFARAYCSSCDWLSEPFRATEHEISGGMNMSEWGPNATAIVKSRIRQSVESPPPVPEIPFGATILF